MRTAIEWAAGVAGLLALLAAALVDIITGGRG